MNEPTIRADRLRRLRALCLGMADTEEKIAWGDPTWRVAGGRMFAGQKGNVPGHRPSLWFAAPPGTQALLVEADPGRFFVPPYVGGQGWVGTWMDLPRIDWAMVQDLLQQARDWAAAGAGRRLRPRAAQQTPTAAKKAKKAKKK